MITTEVLDPGLLTAMPDAELVLRLRRLRTSTASLQVMIDEHRDAPFGRAPRPDWGINAESRLKDLNEALQQVRDEGLRRLRAARVKAT